MIDHDDFRDTAPLDPSRDAARWERMVAGVTAAARPELARRRRLPAPGLLFLLSDWTRPAAGAAAVVTAAAALFLAATPAAPAPGEAEAEALGYPAEVASWLEGGAAPSVEEMVAVLEGVDP